MSKKENQSNVKIVKVAFCEQVSFGARTLEELRRQQTQKIVDAALGIDQNAGGTQRAAEAVSEFHHGR